MCILVLCSQEVRTPSGLLGCWWCVCCRSCSPRKQSFCTWDQAHSLTLAWQLLYTTELSPTLCLFFLFWLLLSLHSGITLGGGGCAYIDMHRLWALPSLLSCVSFFCMLFLNQHWGLFSAQGLLLVVWLWETLCADGSDHQMPHPTPVHRSALLMALVSNTLLGLYSSHLMWLTWIKYSLHIHFNFFWYQWRIGLKTYHFCSAFNEPWPHWEVLSTAAWYPQAAALNHRPDALRIRGFLNTNLGGFSSSPEKETKFDNCKLHPLALKETFDRKFYFMFKICLGGAGAIA